MKDPKLEPIEAILKHFSIKPLHYEKHGRVHRVHSDKGVFALKRISPRQGTAFLRHLQFLFQRGYNRIVPVYPTMDGRSAVLHDNSLYYLMPWLSNEIKEDRISRHQQMFRELARLHTLSSQEVSINKEDKVRHYEKTIHEWEKEDEFLQGYLEQCESKVYMSPFELLFCLYYNDIKLAQDFSKGKFKSWYEKTADNEKARAVVSHGKVSTEHFVFDEKGYGYFINFENSRQGSPLMDLLPFLSRAIHTFPKKCDECVEWIYTYLKYFPLKEEEMLLFHSYFSHPGPIITTVESYYKANRVNEREFVQNLQRKYWLLKNTEYIIMRMEEIEKQKKQQAELETQIKEEKN